LRALKVRLKQQVRVMAGDEYPEGFVVDDVVALDGVPEVVGAGYLPFSAGEWEPALTDRNLDRLLGKR
jgi:hypothetical protein